MIVSFCPNDGTPIQDTDRVCSRCGAPVQPLEGPPVGPAQAPTPAPTQAPTQVPGTPRPPGYPPPGYPSPGHPPPGYPPPRPAYSAPKPTYSAPKPASPAPRPGYAPQGAAYSGTAPRTWFLWPIVNVPARLASGVLDVGIAGVIAVAALVPVALLGQDAGLPDRPMSDLVVATVGALGAALLGILLGTTGATPSAGQAAAGYRLGVNRTGEPAGVGRSLGERALTAILLLAGGFALWSVLWHPRHRGWSERLTGAVMIDGRVPVWRSLLPLLTGVLSAGIYATLLMVLGDLL